LAGCNATSPLSDKADSFKNGQDRYADVLLKMGRKAKEGTTLLNGKSIKTLYYSYASAFGQPSVDDGQVVKRRTQTFFFYDDVLVGHELMSTFAEDGTDFDESKLQRIVSGKTARDEVLKLMGKPAGYYIYPMVASPSDEAAVYTSTTIKASAAYRPIINRKHAVVTFDKSGLVKDVQFTQSAPREP
jgi:hypothetical protein